MSNDGGMDKDDVVHIYNGILLGHKKEWNNPICSNMDGPRDCHTEWSQTEKDKYMTSCLYVESKKKMVQMNLFTKQKKSHRCRKQTYGYQGGNGGEG